MRPRSRMAVSVCIYLVRRFYSVHRAPGGPTKEMKRWILIIAMLVALVGAIGFGLVGMAEPVAAPIPTAEPQEELRVALVLAVRHTVSSDCVLTEANPGEF